MVIDPAWFKLYLIPLFLAELVLSVYRQPLGCLSTFLVQTELLWLFKSQRGWISELFQNLSTPTAPTTDSSFSVLDLCAMISPKEDS